MKGALSKTRDGSAIRILDDAVVPPLGMICAACSPRERAGDVRDSEFGLLIRAR